MHELIFLTAVAALVVANVLVRWFLTDPEFHDLPTMLNDN